MKIEYLKIENFRGIGLELSKLNNNFLIMGRNDTGKSNLCYAIRKVLDPSVRRLPLSESDSTNHNKEDIRIIIQLDVDNLDSLPRSTIGQLIDGENGHEYLYIELKGIYNHELFVYEETLTFGKNDTKEFATNKTNPLDKILDVIYVEPNYKYEKTMENYFSYRKKENESNNKSISSSVLDQTDKMNQAIKDDSLIQEMKAEINENSGFEEIFQNLSFDITSKIEVENIYKSLDISFVDQNGKNVGNIGDGKIKTLAMLLHKSSFSKEKSKIILVEEPENHMYPLLQKSYTKLVEELQMDQFIFTSHSPYIFDLKKMDQIVRLVKDNNGITSHYSINIDSNTYKTFGYMMNEEIGEILFYDSVLLVEGVSEKYFYNSLYHHDEKFRNYCLKENFGVFCVSGVDFAPAKSFLNSLGINVMIKTDNDIFKVPRKNEKRYAGIDRIVTCLDSQAKKELAHILGLSRLGRNTFRFADSLDKKEEIEDKMMDIQQLFANNGFFLSIGHDGFEEDFLEFIGDSAISKEDMEYLKAAKLKNFHKYVMDLGIELKITDENKDSILVRFMNG